MNLAKLVDQIWLMYLDDLCGESMSVEEEEEIISLKFWVTGLLSLITGKLYLS